MLSHPEMVATCPKCLAKTALLLDALSAKGGWMRCGGCWSVFDAYVCLSPLAADPPIDSGERAEEPLAKAMGSAPSPDPVAAVAPNAHRRAPRVIEVPRAPELASAPPAPGNLAGPAPPGLVGEDGGAPQGGRSWDGTPSGHVQAGAATEERIVAIAPRGPLKARRISPLSKIDETPLSTNGGAEGGRAGGGDGLHGGGVGWAEARNPGPLRSAGDEPAGVAGAIPAARAAEGGGGGPEPKEGEATPSGEAACPEGSAEMASQRAAGDPGEGLEPDLKRGVQPEPTANENRREMGDGDAGVAAVAEPRPGWGIFARGRWTSRAEEPSTALGRARLRALSREEAERQGRAAADAKAARVRNIAGAGCSVVLALSLAAQIGYSSRYQAYSRDPELRPLLEGMCRVLGCDVGFALAKDELSLEGADVRMDGQGRLVFSASLKNAAAYESRAPRLWLSIEGEGGEALASRIYEPSEWLGAASIKAGAEQEARMVMRPLPQNPSGYKAELVFEKAAAGGSGPR